MPAQIRVAIVLALAAWLANAHAEAPSATGQQLKLNGKLSLGTATSDRLLGNAEEVFVPRAALKITHTFTPGLYMRYEGEIASRTAHGGDDPAVLRETFLNYRNEQLDVRAGLQNINWGRVDVINPTDNLTPYRYTWLTATDAEQRVGAPAVSVAYQHELGTFNAIALPVFQPSTVPLGNTGGMTVREIKPEGFQNDFALKLERQEAGPEWSLSWFQGRSLRPNLVPAADFSSSNTLELQHPRVNVAGADFAAPWRALLFRAETAYTRAENCCTRMSTDFRKQDNWFTVLGVELAVFENWRLVTQVFHKKNLDEAVQAPATPPALIAIARASDVLNDELKPAYTGVSMGLYPVALGTRFKGSLDAAWTAQTGDYAIRPRLSYFPQGNVSVNLIADLYAGNKEGPLGRLHDNSLVMMNLQWAFDWKSP